MIEEAYRQIAEEHAQQHIERMRQEALSQNGAPTTSLPQASARLSALPAAPNEVKIRRIERG